MKRYERKRQAPKPACVCKPMERAFETGFIVCSDAEMEVAGHIYFHRCEEERLLFICVQKSDTYATLLVALTSLPEAQRDAAELSVRRALDGWPFRYESRTAHILAGRISLKYALAIARHLAAKPMRSGASRRREGLK